MFLVSIRLFSLQSRPVQSQAQHQGFEVWPLVKGWESFEGSGSHLKSLRFCFIVLLYKLRFAYLLTPLAWRLHRTTELTKRDHCQKEAWQIGRSCSSAKLGWKNWTLVYAAYLAPPPQTTHLSINVFINLRWLHLKTES